MVSKRSGIITIIFRSSLMLPHMPLIIIAPDSSSFLRVEHLPLHVDFEANLRNNKMTFEHHTAADCI